MLEDGGNMATVQIRLPSVMGTVVEGALQFSIEAESVGGALEVIAKRFPRVGLHLFDETGGLRPHVLCFHNGNNTRWLDNLDGAVNQGDTLLFMQAVSGG